MEEKYTITFANGYKLEDLTVNGSNYSSSVKLPDGLLTKDNLTHVIIEHNNQIEEKYDQILVASNFWFGEWLFSFRDQTEEEKVMAELDAKIALLKELSNK